jgi:hypothetical protein
MTMNARKLVSLAILLVPTIALAQPKPEFEKQVAEYIKKFPYQETFKMAMDYTKGDPAKFNTWAMGAEPALVKAGEDKVVRMNNDTYYKLAFLDLSKGPVTLTSKRPSKTRFSSFQLMDNRNVNFRNVMHPDGVFTLYHGKRPRNIKGEAIESPSRGVAVIVRVEVKDKNNAKDVAEAKAVFNGIGLDGPKVDNNPELDLLSGFDEKVAKEALRRIDETFTSKPFRELVAGPGEVPSKVSYLKLAAGTKGGWGGPVTSHSSYETIFTDKDGKKMMGRNGTYTITTEEPPVDAFWSVTVYDTERGGFFHPNNEDKYHINNTSAVKNDDGTVTFLFKQKCEPGDVNCLEVPAGQFDIATRYYLPGEDIQSGKWTIPRPVLTKE